MNVGAATVVDEEHDALAGGLRPRERQRKRALGSVPLPAAIAGTGAMLIDGQGRAILRIRP